MPDLTIIYITANREDEEFERKIRGKLLEAAGDNPIVSVSHKPIDLGKNICVGEVGASYNNAGIQMLMGAESVKTKYVAIAEADQLYPPGYFDFRPTIDYPVHMNRDLYILRCWDKGRFWKKEYGEWTTIVDREFFIMRLKTKLLPPIEWGNKRFTSIFQKRKWKTFSVGAPVISVKTPRNLSRVTGVIEGTATAELPHWGNARQLSYDLGLHSKLGIE
jgi:hypothetical protein